MVDGYNIKIDATHSHLKMRVPELRMDIRQTILSVKENLEKRFGTNLADMLLQLQDSHGNVVCMMEDDNEKLASYGVNNGSIIHVIDQNPAVIMGQVENLEDVEKYVISKEDYNKRDDTFKKFKEKMMKENPDFMKVNKTPKTPADYLKEESESVLLGSRCEVTVGSRRGEVRYIGKVKDLDPGFWMGIRLDEPVGDSNGKFGDATYFECGEKYGIFCRVDQIKVGDYPEMDLDDELIEI